MGIHLQRNPHHKMRLLLLCLVLCLATAGLAFPRKEMSSASEEIIEKTVSVKDEKAHLTVNDETPLAIKDDEEELTLKDEDSKSHLKVDEKEKASITIDDDDEEMTAEDDDEGKLRDALPEESAIS